MRCYSNRPHIVAGLVSRWIPELECCLHFWLYGKWEPRPPVSGRASLEGTLYKDGFVNPGSHFQPNQRPGMWEGVGSES